MLPHVNPHEQLAELLRHPEDYPPPLPDDPYPVALRKALALQSWATQIRDAALDCAELHIAAETTWP